MAVLGLRLCARAFSSCGERGPLFIAVCGPLTVAASLVVEHKLQMRRLSSCGSRAQLLRGMWDPPRPGLEPVSPALAGRFSTAAPPGKPRIKFLKDCISRNPFTSQGTSGSSDTGDTATTGPPIAPPHSHAPAPFHRRRNGGPGPRRPPPLSSQALELRFQPVT